MLAFRHSDMRPYTRTVVGKHGSVVICLTTGPDPQRVLYARSDDPATQIEVLSAAPVAIYAHLPPSASRTIRRSAPAAQEAIELAIGNLDDDAEIMWLPKTDANLSPHHGRFGMAAPRICWTQA